MQDGRFSTIRFNEWICLTAQYEKAVARLGRQVYQGFSRGLIVDLPALELCKEISETFAEARSIRLELEEELERDVLDGLSVEETKIADQHRNLTQTQKTTRTLKLRIALLLGRYGINRKLTAHRDRVRELSRDLGLRALVCYKEKPVLNIKGHRSLCRLADQLNEDADKKWTEIVAANKQNGGILSFHTILLNFVGNFANFSKDTPVGKMLLKYFKYDETAENSKLSQAYEGSATAETLRAQLEEIEEPHLDVGREIDNMQQEYEETPVEWNLAASGGDKKPSPSTSVSPAQNYSAAASIETWKPEADAWSPDSSDDDFLDAVADASTPTPSQPPPRDFAPPPSGGPTLLRRRPEPEAESWGESAAKARSVPPPPPKPATENWGWGGEDDTWSTPPQSGAAQIESVAASASSENEIEEDPFDFGQPDESSQQFPSGFTDAIPKLGDAPISFSSPPPSETPSTKPPFVKAEPKNRPAERGWSTPSPSSGGRAGDWGDNDVNADYGWGTPSPQSPPSQPPFTQTPRPAASRPSAEGFAAPKNPAQPREAPHTARPSAPRTPVPPAETPVTPGSPISPVTPFTPEPVTSDPFAVSPSALEGEPSSFSDQDPDPILALLGNQVEDTASPPPPGSEDPLGDDLLPDFLKDRMDDEASADDAFIPELPSFLAGDGPELEIVPFGSKEGYNPVPPADDEEDKPFIPQMPDL